MFNPLSPKSDLNQISHCYIKGLSAGEVMRIKNMTIQVTFSIFKQLLPTTSVRNVWQQNRRICILILGPEGLMLVII